MSTQEQCSHGWFEIGECPTCYPTYQNEARALWRLLSEYARGLGTPESSVFAPDKIAEALSNAHERGRNETLAVHSELEQLRVHAAHVSKRYGESVLELARVREMIVALLRAYPGRDVATSRSYMDDYWLGQADAENKFRVDLLELVEAALPEQIGGGDG